MHLGLDDEENACFPLSDRVCRISHHGSNSFSPLSGWSVDDSFDTSRQIDNMDNSGQLQRRTEACSGGRRESESEE